MRQPRPRPAERPGRPAHENRVRPDRRTRRPAIRPARDRASRGGLRSSAALRRGRRSRLAAQRDRVADPLRTVGERRARRTGRVGGAAGAPVLLRNLRRAARTPAPDGPAPGRHSSVVSDHRCRSAQPSSVSGRRRVRHLLCHPDADTAGKRRAYARRDSWLHDRGRSNLAGPGPRQHPVRCARFAGCRRHARARSPTNGRPSLLLAPPIATWLTRRPRLDPIRFVAGRLADDVAYGLGVWSGSIRAGTSVPLRPALSVRMLRTARGTPSTASRKDKHHG